MALMIRAYAATDEEAVISVWERCQLTRSWNDPRKDIARKVRVEAELFLVGEESGEIVATVMAGYEGHRGWINYLAVVPERQRRGYGELLLREAERLLRERGCPKINLQVRTTNEGVIAFYRHLGYAVDEVVSLSKRLEHDGP